MGSLDGHDDTCCSGTSRRKDARGWARSDGEYDGSTSMALAVPAGTSTSARRVGGRGGSSMLTRSENLSAVRPQLPDLLADAGTALVVEDAGLPGGARGPGGGRYLEYRPGGR